MSKIYEALQRAEKERLARTGTMVQDPAHPEPEQSRESVDQRELAVPDLPEQASPEQVSADPPPRTVFVPIPDGRVDPAAVAADAPTRFFSPAANIFASVVPTPWTPQLDKLPALEERGAAVEQFRSLRTRLFAFRDLNKLKSIMVGSGLPREGKSFIAANLAVSFARHKSTRVLLIDGDMRRSSLHAVFGCQRSPGLSNYLAGTADIQDVLQRMELHGNASAQKVKFPAHVAGLGSLTFIGGGDHGDQAADLSGSKRFHALIERASEYFDWIIVDSSPVNLVTDGVNLAHACDAVLMVARGGVTRFEAVQRALAELKTSSILGVVLNAANNDSRGGEYYGYDGYSSYSSYDSDPPTQEQDQERGQVAQ